jgi:transcriptional regulator with XRE-family HTH domain
MEALAAELSITHQQLQKYETGSSRISVSMLFDIAAALQASVADFFEGLPSPAVAAAAGRRMDGQFERFLASPGGADLMLAFVKLPEAFQQPFVAMAQAAAVIEPTADVAAKLTGPEGD